MATAVPSARSGQVWENTMRDDRDYEHHVDYIHWNSVKHGLTTKVAGWPDSSFHRYVRLGLLPNDWTNDGVAEPAEQYGESL